MTDERITKISRREFLRMATLTTAGAALAACAQPKPAEPAPEKPAEKPAEEPTAQPPAAASGEPVVFYSGWGDSTYGTAWKELSATDEFKQLVGNTPVEVKFGAAEEALLTAVAGGTPPDGCANFNYMDYMARDVVIPIDSYVAASTVVKKEDFLQAVWDIGNYKGKQYGIPANECFVQLGFCWNARLVSEAGFDPEKPPETYDDLYVWHEKLTKFDEAGNVKTIGFDPTDFMGQTIWGSSAWDVSTAWGFEWYDENSGKFNLNNESLVDYFKTAKRFIDLVGIDKLTAFAQVDGQGGWGPAFYAEVLASMLDGYWEPGEMASIKPELSDNNRTGWMPVPASRKGTKAQGAGGHIILLFKGAKNNDLMYKISEWLTTKTPCDVIFKAIGWLPARLTYLDKVDPNTYKGLAFFLKSAKEATYWGKTYKCPVTTFLGTIYPQLREQVFRGEKTAEQAAEEFQTRAEEELKNAGVS